MITLRTKYDDNEELYRFSDKIEGLTVTSKSDADGYTYKEYRWPELGPARLYDRLDDRGVVVSIRGRRYRVWVDIVGDPDDIPERAIVSFEETTDPETPFETYDVVTKQQQYLDHLRAEIVHVEGLLGKDPADDKMYREEIENYRKKISRIEAGEKLVSHNCYAQFFGQPVFIQNPVFPSYNGKSAYPLVTLETGWGDSGNVNILVALDDAGVPCKAWLEASCC